MGMIEFVDDKEGDVVGTFTISRLDIIKSSELLKQLQEAISRAKTKVVLDASMLDFIDSATLGVFIRGHDIARKSNKTLVFTNLSDYTKNTFNNSGLGKVLNFS